jgi:hypothetical protein
MVRAILKGRKTQTRRIVKPRPNLELSDNGSPIHHHSADCPGYCDYACGESVPDSWSPYGIIGDHLWVREGFSLYHDLDGNHPVYKADIEDHGGEPPPNDKWRPSIHMPRWASRITLEITSVRVDRLQDISELDCEAELGVESYSLHDSAYARFRELWDSINGKRAPWSSNPWVWCISFRRITS